MKAPARSSLRRRSLREVRKCKSLGEPNILPLRTACGPSTNGPAWQGFGNLERPCCAARQKDTKRCKVPNRSVSRESGAKKIGLRCALRSKQRGRCEFSGEALPTPAMIIVVEITAMGSGDFEAGLRADLPRGHALQPRSAGRERSLFARWLTPSEMTGRQWQPEGALLLGRREGRLIGWNDDRHLMTIAGSRAGKGVSLIIPNLLFYEGSAVVVDPKGENARITAGRRGRGTRAFGRGLGQDVYVLDPFEVSGMASASFNPLAELDLASHDFAEDAGLFADALIQHPEHGEKHWTELAQALLRALILVALADADPARRNLITVRRLLMLTDEKIDDKLFSRPPTLGKMTGQEALLEILKEQQGPHRDICVGVAGHLEGMGDNERGSVLWQQRRRPTGSKARARKRCSAIAIFAWPISRRGGLLFIFACQPCAWHACALVAADDLACAVSNGAYQGQAPCPGAVRAR